MKSEKAKNFEELGNAIGKLVAEKNRLYGDASVKTAKIMDILFPTGISPANYFNILLLVRVLDKIVRISESAPGDSESPWKDISGYGIIGWQNDETFKEEMASFLKTVEVEDDIS